MADDDAKVQADWDTSFEGPAVAINRYFLISSGNHLRIAFCEQQGVGRPLRFRTAIIMAHADALGLADLIKRFVKGPIVEEKPGPSNA